MSEQLQKQAWICFCVEDEIYAHPVREVSEILKYTEPVPVPGSPDIVKGVLNVRGNIVTILSCHKLLGIKPALDSESHIIIVDGISGRFGITVDGVDAIVELDQSEVMSNEYGRDNGLVRGTVKHQAELLILTDFDCYFKKMGLYA